MQQMKRLMVCSAPFEQGRLCPTCLEQQRPKDGLKRCSRVVAESAAMRALLARARPIAASASPVVIQGESGTGKEVLARTLHVNSPRAFGPFVAVNVAALPEGLLESELFGHVKGAFTGAISDEPGLFKAASGGTLLLDEIVEMPRALQTKLLRTLQDGEVRPIGSTRSFKVDVRLLCASNVDLPKAVAEGRFREDLYYRLNVFRLVLPPLRERPEDVLPLARMFLSRQQHRSRRLTRGAERVLLRHGWPGNVRELANAVEHGAVMSEGADVDVQHLPESVVTARAPNGSNGIRPLADVEKEHILRALGAHDGNQARAARALGIGRTTLWRKLQDYALTEAGAGRRVRHPAS